jgi:hypothetical protein
MGMKKTVFIAIALSLIVLAGCGGGSPVVEKSYTPSMYDTPTSIIISADYTELAPIVDGVVDPLEEAWANAVATDVTVGESTDPTKVRACYDSENIYLQFTWKDESPDFSGKPWEMKGERWGSSITLTKQDMFSVGFVSNKITDFDKQGGCNAICHNSKSMYTNKPGESLDVWTWMSAESAQMGVANNYVVGSPNPKLDTETMDVKAGYTYMPGALIQNKRDTRSPLYVLEPGIPYDLNTIGDLEFMTTAPADPKTLGPDAKAPYYIKLPGQGCIKAMATYNDTDKVWTLEMKRSLRTGNPLQVQFSHDPAEDAYYMLGFSIFDNQSAAGHIYTADAITLQFVGK